MRFMRHQLTELLTLNFLCHDGKDGKNLNHDLGDYIHHGRCLRGARVYFKSMEGTFDAMREVNKTISA